MKTAAFFLTLIIILFMTTSCKNRQKADLIVHHATIYTVNAQFDTVSAFAVIEGNFVAVGSEKEILENFSSENVIDAKGMVVFPGFNDGHSHFVAFGLDEIQSADLIGSQSFQEVIKKVVEHSLKNDSEWIRGRGWDQNDWSDQLFPTKDTLDILFPDKPVVLSRIDGHAVLVNSETLRRASITSETKIEGGEIILLNGEPTGILIDNSIDLISRIVPKPTEEEKTRALKIAQEKCFAAGLTTVTDAGLDLKTILLIDSLQRQNELNIRIYAMMDPTEENFSYFFKSGPMHTGKLTVSSVKLYVDGALGSRGALLLEPYADSPATIGLQLHPQQYFNEICQRVYNAGFQVNTHAIGDSGNRLMLETYTAVLKEKNDRRWRVEHAQIVEPADLHFFGHYSIIPSVQSTHCTSDMYWAGDRLGENRIKTAYASKDLLDQNGWLVNGTDFPVENINPILTFYAAVARKDIDGWPAEGFQMENALSREDALRSITIWPAKGSFDENQKGSIELGKAADFVILKENIMIIPESEIPSAKVFATFINGKEVYKMK